MKVKLEQTSNGPELSIKVPVNLAGTVSRSGKTTLIATSRGQQYIGKVNGQNTYLQLNVLQSDRELQTTGRDGKPLTNVVEITSGRKAQHRVTKDVSARGSRRRSANNPPAA